MAWGVPKIGTVAEDNKVATGELTLTEPAGIAQGDLMIAAIAFRENVAFTAPSGWEIAAQESSGDTDASNGIASAVLLWGVRGASPPALTFNQVGPANIVRGCIIAYSGGTNPTLDTSSSNTLAVASATVTTGSLTTTADGDLIVAVVGAGDTLTVSAFDAATDPATASGATDTTNAPSNGTWRERVDSPTATGVDLGFAVADAIRATAGSTGTIQATVSASARHAMVAAAFKLVGPTNVSGSGASVTTLSAFSSGSATQTFTGSGASVTTLSATSAGTATNTPPAGPPPVTGSGASVTTLSAFSSGVAEQTIKASGASVTTLSAFSAGVAEQTIKASGASVVTLSAFSAGVAEQTLKASGASVATLSATSAGTATNTPPEGPVVSGSGTSVATLSAFSSGTATNTPPGEEPPPPPRRPRGHWIFEDEPPEPKLEEEEEQLIAAIPLAEVIPIPAIELRDWSWAKWHGVELPPAPPRKRPRPQPEIDEDEDDFEDLLEILAAL